MAGRSSYRPRRADGAVLSSLLHPRRVVRRPADSYGSLAEAIADNLPKPLQEELARALGIDPEVADLAEPAATEDAQPEEQPPEHPAATTAEDELIETFGLRKAPDEKHYAQRPVDRSDTGKMYPPMGMDEDLEGRFKIKSGYVDPKTGTRYLSVADYLHEKQAKVRKQFRARFKSMADDALIDEIIVDQSGRITPSFIARAVLFDAVVMHGDKDFKKRFDRVFGWGSANYVLTGARFR
jgi:hypothetical protein